MAIVTFIIDCPFCKAKVGALEKGRADRAYFDDEAGKPYGERIYVGSCPRCNTLLVGESRQINFKDIDSEEDRWSDIVRVYPKPPKTFSSYRIPRVVEDSLAEADRSLQTNANIAACVMFGRALEAVCRDILKPKEEGKVVEVEKESAAPKKKIMLAAGIKQLKEKNFIDERLYNWSQQLHAFRNLAAHPEEISISREDAEDLQAFVYAITEYIYDLTDRYEDFKARAEKRAKRKKT